MSLIIVHLVTPAGALMIALCLPAHRHPHDTVQILKEVIEREAKLRLRKKKKKRAPNNDGGLICNNQLLLILLLMLKT